MEAEKREGVVGEKRGRRWCWSEGRSGRERGGAMKGGDGLVLRDGEIEGGGWEKDWEEGVM